MLKWSLLPWFIIDIVKANSSTICESVTLWGDDYNPSLFATFLRCFLHCVQQQACQKKMTCRTYWKEIQAIYSSECFTKTPTFLWAYFFEPNMLYNKCNVPKWFVANSISMLSLESMYGPVVPALFLTMTKKC